MSKFYKSPRISSEFKDCSLQLTFDCYNKCSFGCAYCFGLQFALNNPACKKSPELGVVNVDSLSKVIKGEKPDNPYYRNFYKDRFVFHWGGLTDPFCYLERKMGKGLQLIKTLAELQYPTLFSTKGLSLFLEDKDYIKVFEKNSKYKNFAFQFSIITNRDDLSSLVEPNTPLSSERLKAMKRMSDLGYLTILRLRPFIIGISDIEIEELLTRSKEAGARGISLEFFALDERVVPQLQKQLETISKITGFDVHKYLKGTSPSSRGTYMRSNRDVKEPYMKRIYKKCMELGLNVSISDPDYKELNFSGCCCGLFEEYPENPELTNWSRGQLTYFLKELRKRYWLSKGKDNLLYFDDIRKNMFNNWADEPKYASDSIKFWQSDYARDNTGHIREYIESWNNTRSPDNPYNYFNGKIKPVFVKDNKLVYQYVPSNYEKRWITEGLLK